MIRIRDNLANQTFDYDENHIKKLLVHINIIENSILKSWGNMQLGITPCMNLKKCYGDARCNFNIMDDDREIVHLVMGNWHSNPKYVNITVIIKAINYIIEKYKEDRAVPGMPRTILIWDPDLTTDRLDSWFKAFVLELIAEITC